MVVKGIVVTRVKQNQSAYKMRPEEDAPLEHFPLPPLRNGGYGRSISRSGDRAENAAEEDRTANSGETSPYCP